MDLADVIGHLTLSLVFILLGLFALFRKNARVGVGGGRTGGSPLFAVEIKGAAATTLASSTIIGGSLVGLPYVLVILGNDVSEELLFLLPFLGIGTIFLGFVSSLMVQAVIAAGEQIREYKENADNDVSKSD